MHPWGITIKPCIGSKERTKNDSIRAFYCALDSILSARIRALKTLCAALACPSEICVSGITKILLLRSFLVSSFNGSWYSLAAFQYLQERPRVHSPPQP